VPGGGTALTRAAGIAKSRLDESSFDRDALMGYHVVLRACEEPLKQLADNVGKDDGAVIVQKVKDAGGNAGYDAVKAEIIPDMISAGIIDPVKVERAGIQHAVSAAAVLLTSEVAIADLPEPEKPAGAPDMGGMGGY
jgi:chaperonin GroEL